MQLNSFIELAICEVDAQERKVVLPAGGPIKIGSGAECDVVIEHPCVAPCHARLLFDRGIVILEPSGDAGVRDRVRLDGEPVTAPMPVRAGQKMAVGPTVLMWRWLPKEEWPTMPGARLEGQRKSAVVELAEDVKRGRYRSGSEVGRGGMGRILQAEETPLRRSVAMKVLLTSERGQGHAEERFIREARITGGLEHPSIVPVHELNVDETGRVFYTMKLVKGLTLREILHRLSNGEPEARRRYKLQSLLTIFQKVCDAVAFAHAQPNPIIHRDLKPDNIMVGEYGEVLVLDWGLAKVLGRHDTSEDDKKHCANGDELGKDDKDKDNALLVTQPGTAMGTPGYMAPEQIRGQADAADERTDIYALGASLYAMLTLAAPTKITAIEAKQFEERTRDSEAVTEHFRIAVAPLLSNRSQRPRLDHLPGRTLPDSIAAVVLKAMAFRPADRFASVKELQRDVAAYQAGFATSAEEARASKRFKLLVARNKLLFTAMAGVFAILLSATVISLRQRQAALESNNALQITLRRASFADHETARQRFRAGAWREGLALMGRCLTFWPENAAAADFLLSSIIFGRGDEDKLPLFGVEHDGAVYEGDFSPDGRYFVTASYDHTARIWETATGTAVGKTLQHSGPLSSVRFSPDGRKIVTAGEDGFARVWDAHSGEPLTKPMKHGKPALDGALTVETAVFSPDGKRILTACWDHTARVWNAETGEEIAQLLHPHRVASAVFNRDGTRILTSYWYGGAMLWDAVTFQAIGEPMRHGATVRTALFTPDGRKVVTASLDKTARIWDTETGKPLSAPLQHNDAVWTLAVSPDGRVLATACYDKTARLWSLADGAPIGAPMEHDGPVDSVAFSADGNLLLTASRDKTVRLWDTGTCKPVAERMLHDDSVWNAIFSPDGSKILSLSWDHAAYMWHTRSQLPPGELLSIPGDVRMTEFTSDPDQIFIAERMGHAGIWSLTKNRFVTPTVDHGSEIVAAAISGTDRFATAGADGFIRFWDRSGMNLGKTSGKNGAISALVFSSDGLSMFVAYQNGSVVQWKCPEGTQLGEPMKHPEKMDAIAIAPSGKEVATGCRDDFVRFWDSRTGAATRRNIRVGDPILAMSYHPDEQTLATGSADHKVRIWSLTTGLQVGLPFMVNGPASYVRYMPGGGALLVGGYEDKEVNCYDTKTGAALFVGLSHPEGVIHVTAHRDGSQIITVTTDGKVRLWRVPIASLAPPAWLGDYLRVIGGLAFSAQQQVTQVPMRERLALRKALLARQQESSIWDQVMTWSFQRTASRAPDPWYRTDK